MDSPWALNAQEKAIRRVQIAMQSPAAVRVKNNRGHLGQANLDERSLFEPQLGKSLVANCAFWPIVEWGGGRANPKSKFDFGRTAACGAEETGAETGAEI